MQRQVSLRGFQRFSPLKLDTTLPISRLSTNPINMLQESRAKSMVLQIKTKMDEIEERICPNPLMPRPGEKNPLGEYSPYLPPLQIPGIRRAPRPIEEDPIPGSKNLLKIRRPSPDGPYAQFRNDFTEWHSFVDEHISSCLSALYVGIALIILFEPHNLTFIETLRFLK